MQILDSGEGLIVKPYTVAFVRQAVRDAIGDLYDDPLGYSNHIAEIIQRHDDLQIVAHDVGLNFEVMVNNRTTAYERKRMDHIRCKCEPDCGWCE